MGATKGFAFASGRKKAEGKQRLRLCKRQECRLYRDRNVACTVIRMPFVTGQEFSLYRDSNAIYTVRNLTRNQNRNVPPVKKGRIGAGMSFL